MLSVSQESRKLNAAIGSAGINVPELSIAADISEVTLWRRITGAWEMLVLMTIVDAHALPDFVSAASEEGAIRRRHGANQSDAAVAEQARRKSGINIQEFARVSGESRSGLYKRLQTASTLLVTLEHFGPPQSAWSFATGALLRGFERRELRNAKRVG
jgi:hypothetical protein